MEPQGLAKKLIPVKLLIVKIVEVLVFADNCYISEGTFATVSQ